MSYEIRWDTKARDFLRTIDKGDARRIFQKIDSIKDNPKRFLERLVGINSYKLRIGDYRAIIDLDESNNVLEVLLIGHRKNIYKEIRK